MVGPKPGRRFLRNPYRRPWRRVFPLSNPRGTFGGRTSKCAQHRKAFPDGFRRRIEGAYPKTEISTQVKTLEHAAERSGAIDATARWYRWPSGGRTDSKSKSGPWRRKRAEPYRLAYRVKSFALRRSAKSSTRSCPTDRYVAFRPDRPQEDRSPPAQGSD